MMFLFKEIDIWILLTTLLKNMQIIIFRQAEIESTAVTFTAKHQQHRGANIIFCIYIFLA